MSTAWSVGCKADGTRIVTIPVLGYQKNQFSDLLILDNHVNQAFKSPVEL